MATSGFNLGDPTPIQESPYPQTTQVRRGVQFNNTNDPKKAAQNDRGRAAETGDVLDQDIRTQVDRNSNTSGRNQELGDALQGELRDTPGYTPGEQEAILRTHNTEALGQLSPGDYAKRFMTPEEQAGSIGDPTKVATDFGAELDPVTQQAMQELGLSIDPQRMQQDPAYAQQIKQIVGDYAQKRVYSDQDVEGIAGAGARDVGLRYQAAIQDAERNAVAGGARDPGAQASIRRDLERDSAVGAADARVNAEIQARELQKGSMDKAAGLQTSVLPQVEQQRINAGQGLTTALMQRATSGADIGTRAAQLKQGANASAETQLAQRVNGVATNRQATETGAQTTAHDRGVQAETALSQRNQTVADARRTGQQQVLTDVRGQQQEADNNINTQTGQRVQANLGTQGLQNDATRTLLQSKATPGVGERLISTAIGAAAGAAPALLGGGKAEGGVFTEPTQITVGESGPEAVVPMGAGASGGSAMPGASSPFSRPPAGGGPMRKALEGMRPTGPIPGLSPTPQEGLMTGHIPTDGQPQYMERIPPDVMDKQSMDLWQRSENTPQPPWSINDAHIEEHQEDMIHRDDQQKASHELDRLAAGAQHNMGQPRPRPGGRFSMRSAMGGASPVSSPRLTDPAYY